MAVGGQCRCLTFPLVGCLSRGLGQALNRVLYHANEVDGIPTECVMGRGEAHLPG